MAVRQGIWSKAGVAVISAWLMAMPLSAHALGFGNIKLNSTLNEPLDAEIELLSATEEEMRNLDVKLASREAFLRAGVEKTNFLSELRFKIKEKGGKYYIHLTTPRTVREPFLNFLLEMNWENGRMLREYTVLLDPPDRAPQPQAVVEAPATAAPVVEAPAPAPEETARAPQPAPESPFLEPVPEPEPQAAPMEMAEAGSGELYPQIPLDTPPQGPAPEASMQPEPEPAPAAPPVAAAQPPALEVEEVPPPQPETAAPAPEQMAQAEPFMAQEEQLYPQIPLTAYGEQAPAPSRDYQPVGDLDYGITRKGDNVWTIAQKIRPGDQVSIYQVMMALQRSNPEAFVDGNIHRLKEGQVLRIDDANLLTAMSKSEAAQAYQQQTQAWHDYLASVGSDVPRQAIMAGDTGTARAEATGPASGEVTLSTPSGEDVAAAGTSGEAASADVAMLREQVRRAMEEAASERRKSAENVARLEELEQRLDELNRTISIRNDELAQLRATLEQYKEEYGKLGEGAGSAPESGMAASETPPSGGVWGKESEVSQEEIAENTKSGGVWGESPETGGDTQMAAGDEPPVEPDTATFAPEEPAGDSGMQQPAEAPSSAPAPSQPAASEPPAPQETGGGVMGMVKGVLASIGSLFQGGLYVIIGAAAAVIVVLLAVVLLIRRRRGMQFQESILTGGGSATEAQSAAADASPSSDSSLASGESSFLSDFAISGVSAIQAEDSEVDPLTEADVFMAYGRYEAAEERLQEAIKNDPNRGELRVKLLELYSTTKNKQGFESVAEDFYATLGDDADNDPLWQKVVSMGKDIAPDNPLFSGGGGGGAAAAMGAAGAGMAASAPGLSDSQVMDIGLDTGVFQTEDFDVAGESQPSAEAGGEADELDFNLDLGGTETTEETEQPKAQGDDLDFNLDFDSGEEATTETPQPSLDEGGLDFNLEEPEIKDEAAGPVADDAESLEFNLDMSDEEPTAIDMNLEGEAAQDETEDFSLDFDLQSEDEPAKPGAVGELAEQGTEDEGMDMNLDAADAIDLDMPSGGDEVGTKLDLAKAYIDMGDPEGARSILDEVMEEGNEGQKQEAEQLMQQIV